jgi:hypothetical protein
LAFSPRVKIAESRRGAEGGDLGSPLAGFLPNTEISFLMISPKLLDIYPVFLLYFLLLKQQRRTLQLSDAALCTEPCRTLNYPHCTLN